MEGEGVAIARLQEQLRALASDVAELVTEVEKARQRLHKLEGTTALFLNAQQDARRKEAEQYRKLGVRIQVLTVVVGLAAILAPIVSVILTGK